MIPTPARLSRRAAHAAALVFMLCTAGAGAEIIVGIDGIAVERLQALQAAASPAAAEQMDPVAYRALRDYHGPDLAGRDGALARVGLPLLMLHHRHRLHRETKAAGSMDLSDVPFDATSDEVLVDIVAVSADATALRLAADSLGLKSGSTAGRMVSGWLPIEQVVTLAKVPELAFARPVYAVRNVGSVTSQADTALRTSQARMNQGVDGTGVTIGVISDSFNCLSGEAAGVASGDLPAGIVVLQELSPCAGGIDEGRAMMELVHDLAPGSPLAFHTAFNGTADFANGIVELAQVAGAGVIVDDIGILSQPWYQDGIVAQAVDQVVALGVPYFSSAGNFGRQSYEAPFLPSGVSGLFGGERHDFDSSAAVDDLQSITIPAGTNVRIFLQWTDPFFSISGAPGAATDIDLVVYDGATAIAVSSANNIGGDAFEAISLTNTGTAPGTVDIALERFAGPDPALVKYAYIGGITVNEFVADTQARSIFGHANSRGARAVGASFYFFTPEFGTSPPLLEGFSSREGTTILFDTNGNPVVEPRLKPEIVAVDGVDNTFFGGGDSEGNGFPNFFGTSAAAPNAAAVAALMLDANPHLTPGQLYALLQESTIEMETPGFDVESGFGLIQADIATAGAEAIINGALASFTSGPDGEPLSGSLESDAYSGQGLTITDSDAASVDSTPLTGPSDPSNAATGIVGNFLDVPAVGGTTTFVELAFSVPTRRVRFSFASPSGSVLITARDTGGNILAQVTENRALTFTHPTAGSWLGGTVEVESIDPIATLRIEPVPGTEPLVVDSVYGSPNPVTIPLPFAALAMLAALLGALGSRRLRRTAQT